MQVQDNKAVRRWDIWECVESHQQANKRSRKLTFCLSLTRIAALEGYSWSNSSYSLVWNLCVNVPSRDLCLETAPHQFVAAFLLVLQNDLFPAWLPMQVAIKKMKRKFYSWEECMNLREVKVSSRI
jgi:hypothetical protein